ncbi:hypothetical protein ACO0RG_001567 [Hanseniaspora osmophila]
MAKLVSMTQPSSPNSSTMQHSKIDPHTQTSKMSDFETRLKAVRKKRVDLKIKMRKDVQLWEQQGVRRTEKEDSYEENSTDWESNRSRDKKSDFDYTMRDFERWESSKKTQSDDQSKTDLSDYDVLSKHTYDKEIAALVRERNVSTEKVSIAKASSPSVVVQQAEHGLLVNDDKLKVQDLANRLKRITDKRYKKRTRDMIKREEQFSAENNLGDAYVNEKNKQFNMKLDRELAKRNR